MTNGSKRCFKCSKALLYILSLLFWMLGAALLGLGIWLHLTNDVFLAISPGYSLLLPSALFIAPGCLSILVGFLGCCGAITENKCLVISYCVLMVIVLLLEIVGGTVAFVGEIQVKAHSQIEDQLMVSISERYPGGEPEHKHEQDIVKGWDLIQEKHSCCGVNGYTDWYNSHGWRNSHRVPDSCCIEPSVGCGSNEIYHSNWYTQGCSQAIKHSLELHLFAVAVTAMAFAGLQLFAVIGAIVFLHYRKKQKLLR